MTKHTPGPWLYEQEPHPKWGSSRVVIDGMGFSSPYLLEPGSGRCVDTDANNRLIAAAPDLLAACKAAHELTIKYARPGDDQGYQFSNVVTGLLREAIAKAEGVTPAAGTP